MKMANKVAANSSTSITSGLMGKSEKKHRLKQRFQVIKKLGQGTYGKVQLAINKETGQEVAIKTIKKSKIESEKDLIRIRREIQIMSSIQHPYIIHIFEVFENKDKIVLVMQYANGGELYEYVSERKKLTDNEARRIFRQIATAIYYCHKNKVCHRDLKLENILLDERNNAKIGDFGLSNVFDLKNYLNTFCGSPLYASPEIVKGTPYYGPEVDCWSLGVLLYTLVYGAMPFDGSNYKQLVKLISEAKYFEPKIRSDASSLIRKLLCVTPNKRATIIDICKDAWVNKDYERSLLQIAEDLTNLTPVKIDVLLALAPIPNETKILNENKKLELNENLKCEVQNAPSIQIQQAGTTNQKNHQLNSEQDNIKRRKSTKKNLEKNSVNDKNENSTKNKSIKTFSSNNESFQSSNNKKANKNEQSKTLLNLDSDYVSEEQQKNLSINKLIKKELINKESQSVLNQIDLLNELNTSNNVLNEENLLKSSSIINRFANKVNKTEIINQTLIKNKSNEIKKNEKNEIIYKTSESSTTNLSRKLSTKSNKTSQIATNESQLSFNQTSINNNNLNNNITINTLNRTQSKVGNAKRIFEKPRHQDSFEREKQGRIILSNKVSDVKNKFERRSSLNANSSFWRKVEPSLIVNASIKENINTNEQKNSDINKLPKNNVSIKNENNNQETINKTETIKVSTKIPSNRQSNVTTVNSTNSDNTLISPTSIVQNNDRTNLKIRRHTVKSKQLPTSTQPNLIEIKRKELPLTNDKLNSIENSILISTPSKKVISSSSLEINKNLDSIQTITDSTGIKNVTKIVKNTTEKNAMSEKQPVTPTFSPTVLVSNLSPTLNEEINSFNADKPKLNIFKANQSKLLNEQPSSVYNVQNSISSIKTISNEQISSGLSSPSIAAKLAPIARSYKKISFTKDGATITETGKIISEETPSGTKITKKIITKKSTSNPENDTIEKSFENKSNDFSHGFNDNEFESFSSKINTSSNINKSESTSSSGSADIFEEMFDTWVGDPMFNKISNKFRSILGGGTSNILNNCSKHRNNFSNIFNENKSSINKRAESYEQKANNDSFLLTNSNNYFKRPGYATEGESDTDNEEHCVFGPNVDLWKFLSPNSMTSRLLNKHRSLLSGINFFNDNSLDFGNKIINNNSLSKSREHLKLDSKPPTSFTNRFRQNSRDSLNNSNNSNTTFKTTFTIGPDGINNVSTSIKNNNSSDLLNNKWFSEISKSKDNINSPQTFNTDIIYSDNSLRNSMLEFEPEMTKNFQLDIPMTIGTIKPQNLFLNKSSNSKLSSSSTGNLNNLGSGSQIVHEIPIQQEKNRSEVYIPIIKQRLNVKNEDKSYEKSLLDELKTHGYRNLLNQRHLRYGNLNTNTNSTSTNNFSNNNSNKDNNNKGKMLSQDFDSRFNNEKNCELTSNDDQKFKTLNQTNKYSNKKSFKNNILNNKLDASYYNKTVLNPYSDKNAIQMNNIKIDDNQFKMLNNQIMNANARFKPNVKNALNEVISPTTITRVDSISNLILSNKQKKLNSLVIDSKDYVENSETIRLIGDNMEKLNTQYKTKNLIKGKDFNQNKNGLITNDRLVNNLKKNLFNSSVSKKIQKMNSSSQNNLLSISNSNEENDLNFYSKTHLDKSKSFGSNSISNSKLEINFLKDSKHIEDIEADDYLNCSIKNQVNQIRHLIDLLNTENDFNFSKDDFNEKEKLLKKTHNDLNELKNDLKILRLKNKIKRCFSEKTQNTSSQNKSIRLKNNEKYKSRIYNDVSTETSKSNSTLALSSEEEDDDKKNVDKLIDNKFKSLPPLPPLKHIDNNLTIKNGLYTNLSNNYNLNDTSNKAFGNDRFKNIRSNNYLNETDILTNQLKISSKLNHNQKNNFITVKQHGNLDLSNNNRQMSFLFSRLSSSLNGCIDQLNTSCSSFENKPEIRTLINTGGCDTKETVQERILRKSFYTRFNSPDRYGISNLSKDVNWSSLKSSKRKSSISDFLDKFDDCLNPMKQTNDVNNLKNIHKEQLTRDNCDREKEQNTYHSRSSFSSYKIGYDSISSVKSSLDDKNKVLNSVSTINRRNSFAYGSKTINLPFNNSFKYSNFESEDKNKLNQYNKNYKILNDSNDLNFVKNPIKFNRRNSIAYNSYDNNNNLYKKNILNNNTILSKNKYKNEYFVLNNCKQEDDQLLDIASNNYFSNQARLSSINAYTLKSRLNSLSNF